MRKFKNVPKKVYKKAKPQKFPRNYRFIPEKINADEAVFTLGILCIFVAILVVAANLYINLKEEKRLVDDKIKILKDEAFWKEQTKLRPNFRDAYFSLALINFQLKDFDKTDYYLTKTLNLDPNFLEARQLQRILNSK